MCGIAREGVTPVTYLGSRWRRAFTGPVLGPPILPGLALRGAIPGFSLELRKYHITFNINSASDLDDVLQKYLDSNAYTAEVFESFERAVLTAVMKDKGTDRALIQEAWNRLNSWAMVPPPPSTSNYPLPTAGVKAPAKPKKSVPTTVTKKTYSTRLTDAVDEWIGVMREVCLASGTKVADIDWVEVRVNLLLLTDFRDEDGFVTKSLEAPSGVETSKVARALSRLKQGPGLKSLLEKIQKEVDPGKEENASGNIYGAFSEMMDLFFSLVQSLELPESRISAPSKYKAFTEPKTVPGTRIDPKALWQQDIDRTEIVKGHHQAFSHHPRASARRLHPEARGLVGAVHLGDRAARLPPVHQRRALHPAGAGSGRHPRESGPHSLVREQGNGGCEPHPEPIGHHRDHSGRPDVELIGIQENQALPRSLLHGPRKEVPPARGMEEAADFLHGPACRR
ncbi:hypothetical protein [Corallococcus exiguus]|uniref:hypothetical protein n=1 Tax=Corallococcus exiguus TaxID=83462 RepID=UPI0015604CF8|nr:hypothetical protein [Corallococcus exiguus]NRD44922.1 hypothetical protein [Corallococcus exiguus]